MKIPFLFGKSSEEKIKQNIDYDIKQMEQSLMSLCDVIVKLQNEKKNLEKELANLKKNSEEPVFEEETSDETDDVILNYNEENIMEKPAQKKEVFSPAAKNTPREEAIRWLREKHGIEKADKKKTKKKP